MTQINLEAKWDLTDAERGGAAYHRLLQKIDQETKELAKSSRRAGSEAGGAFRKTGSSARSAGSDVNKLKTETSGFETAAANAAKSARNFVLGFVGISGIVNSMKSIVNDIKEVAELRKEFTQITLEVDKLAQPLATLSGDVSQAGINRAGGKIRQLSNTVKIAPEISERILYKTESVFDPGSQAASNAALLSGKMTAALRMDAEAGQRLPGLMRVAGAETPKQQEQLLNKLYKAASISEAEAPEYIQNLPELYSVGLMRGYKDNDILTMYNALIAVSGGNTARGAEMAKRVMAVTSGRNEKAMKFLDKLAKNKLGKSVGELSDPERQELASQAFQEAKDQGLQDEFKNLDAKGFEALLAINSSRAQQIMSQAPSEIQSAADSNILESMFQQYLKTDIASFQALENEKRFARADTGRSNMAVSRFKIMYENIMEQTRANLTGPGQNVRMFFRPDKDKLQMDMVRNMLMGVYNDLMDQYGSEGFARQDPRFQEVMSLLMVGDPGDIEAHPGFLNRLYNLTGYEMDQLNDPLYNRGLQAYKQANPQYGPTNEAAMKELTGAVNQLNSSIQKISENNVMIDTGD